MKRNEGVHQIIIKSLLFKSINKYLKAKALGNYKKDSIVRVGFIEDACRRSF